MQAIACRSSETFRRREIKAKRRTSQNVPRASHRRDAVPQDINPHGLRPGSKRKFNQNPNRAEESLQHSSGHSGKQKLTIGDKKAEIERENEQTSVLLCEDDKEWTQLVDKCSPVDKEYPQSYSQKVDIKGACPLFRSTVLSHNDQKWNDLPEGHQLQRTQFSHTIQDKVKSALKEYVAGKPFTAWTSEYLALALNLKTSNLLKDSLQSLFLAQNKPPVILVVCGEDEDIQKSALAYVGEMARALTTSLLNYCHCEFILLACVISKDTLSAEILHEKIEEKRKETSKIYYRRQHLSRSEYLQLKKAVTRVSRVSPVRHHLADSSDTRQTQENKETLCQELVILDEDWYNLVLYFINKVMQGNQRFTFPHPSKDTVALKVKVAAKEACRRLGVKATCTESQGCLEIHIEETPGQQ